jgi:hypothetical protein
VKIVVVPDAHAMPLGSRYDNERFTWLGKFVKDEKPDCVISIGDWADIPSLAGFDPLGSIQTEGQRYADDVAGSVDALERFELASKGWSGRKVITLGNHDVRADRAAARDAKMHGTLSSKDLQFEDHGWEVIPFLERFELEEIGFRHYVVKTNARHPIGGERCAWNLAQYCKSSVVVGHNHLLTYAHTMKDNGEKMFAMSVGHYGHIDYGVVSDPKTSWAKTSAPAWDNCLVVLVTDGKGFWKEKRVIYQRTLERRYGDPHLRRKRR